MVEILLGNSHSQIKNLPPETCKRLWETFRYRSPNAFRRGGKPIPTQYVYLTKHQNGQFSFPSGLLKLIKSALDKRGIAYQVLDNRPLPPKPKGIPFIKMPPPLRSYQQYALDLFDENSRGTICLPTGLGKTLLCIYLIRKLGQKIIFIVPSLNLKNQTIDEFRQYFPRNMYDDEPGKTIFVINYQALANKPKDYFKDYNALIIDEAHHSSCDTLYDLNDYYWNHIYYRIFVSATPYRNDGTDMKLYSVIGDILFNYPIDRAINDGWIAKPYFYVFKVPPIDIGFCESFHEEYRKGIVENEVRNQMIVNIANQMFKNDRHILILVKEIEHGESLYKKIKELGINVKFMKGETSNAGQRENKKVLNEFRGKSFPILIGTSVIGEGIDVKTIDTVINASGYKAKSEIVQKIGRSLRILEGKGYAIIIDFLDQASQNLNKHSLERIEHFKIYKSEINFI